MTDENVMPVDSGLTDDSSRETAQQGFVQQDLGSSAQPAQQEKVLTQSEVNNLLAAEKRKAYAKGAESAQANRSAEQEVTQYAQKQPELNIDSLVDKRVTEIVQQQERLLAEQQAKVEVDKCVEKITEIAERGKQSIDGFEASMEKVDGFRNALNLLKTVSDIDNAEHVLHYLSENPAVIPSLDALAASIPGAAKSELGKISARLKQNADAKNAPLAPEPLSHIAPKNETRGGIGSSHKPQSEYSVRDFMGIYKG